MGVQTAIWFVSIVTAPFLAKSDPCDVALVVSVMLVRASVFPTKAVPVPSVSELPTCQNTLQSEPPLMTTTLAALAVVRVLPVWKMKTALGLF